MQDVYRTDSSPNAKPWKPKGIQIISPGIDHDYGFGGFFDTESAELKSNPHRKAEFDNVTNFAVGILVQQSNSFFPNGGNIGLAPLWGLLLGERQVKSSP